MVSLEIFQNGPEVFELVKQLPDVVLSAVHSMGVQVGKRGIMAIAIKGFLGRPFHENEYGTRLDLSNSHCPKLPQSNDPTAMGVHLFGGSARLGPVLVSVRDIEEVQGINRIAHHHSLLVVGEILGWPKD